MWKVLNPNFKAAIGYRKIWHLSWPILLSNLSFPFVSLVDTAVMGHLSSPSLLGGVALGTLVFNIIYFSFGFLRMSTTAYSAQAFGRRDKYEIQELLGQAIFLGLGMGLVVLASASFLLPTLEWAFRATPEVEAHMLTYVAIRLYAVPGALMNLSLLGWLFGTQAMRLAMFNLLAVNLLNIGLNIFFVFRLGMGIEGVAFASVLAQWTGFILTLILMVLYKNKLGLTHLRLQMAHVFKGSRLAAFFSTSGPLFLRTLVLNFVIAALMWQAARLGDIELAATQIIYVIFFLVASGLDGFAHTIEALAGEAIGRRDKTLLKQVIIRSIVLAFLVALFMAVAIQMLPHFYLPLLTDQPALLEYTFALVAIVAIIPMTSFLAFMMDGVFVGAAQSMSMLMSMSLAGGVYFLLVAVFAPQTPFGLLVIFNIFLFLRGVILTLLLPKIFNFDNHLKTINVSKG